MIILFLAFWVVCGIIHHGMKFAYFQRSYALIAEEHYWSDMIYSILTSFFGPIALLAHLLFMSISARYPYQGMKFY